MKNYPVVMIEWEDASSSDDWHTLHEEYETCMIISIGWLVEENDNHCTIMQNLDYSGDVPLTVSGRMTIPHSNIKKIEVIRK